METKTNAMRMLDKAKIKYNVFEYNPLVATNGKEIAEILRENPNKVFKTLVLVAKSKKHYVFMLPVGKELDLKKCAQAVCEKNIEMLAQKQLFDLTGYVHGGCSPIGQKKKLKTIIDLSAKNFDTIYFSAGKVGMQLETRLDDLAKVVDADFADITREC